MKDLKSRTGEMTDEELRTAFEEYVDLEITGILKQGVAKQIESEYKETFNITEPVLNTVRQAIYFEMALRFYDQP